jgi:hypothetical protein
MLPDHDVPDHDLFDHDLFDHERFDHERFDHERFDHDRFAHELPVHAVPAQLLSPSQPLPVHTEPFQVPSDHAAPTADNRAQRRPSHGWPMMSVSPVSSTPSSATCSPPRAASSDPEPLAVGHVWGRLGCAGAVVAARTSIIPPPASRADAPASGVADFRKIAFTMSGVRLGRASSRRATAPAVTAVACDVPVPRK